MSAFFKEIFQQNFKVQKIYYCYIDRLKIIRLYSLEFR